MLSYNQVLYLLQILKLEAGPKGKHWKRTLREHSQTLIELEKGMHQYGQ